MKLAVFKREKKGKSALTRIRTQKNIPAVLYGKIANSPAFVKGADFLAVLRKLEKNHLSSTIFTIDYEGTSYKAIVKGIAYNKITYYPIHIDLMVVEEGDVVDINIPILFTGVVDCAGIKLGGVLRQVIRSFKVRCLVKDIPSSFSLNIQEMQVGDKKRLADISLPEGITPLLPVSEVVVTIAKR